MIFKKKKNNKKGFSVIELIVVLSIFALISSVSLFNYNGYQSRIARVNTAQDIALTVRQAQVYGLSASGRDLGDSAFDTPGAADTFFGTTVADIITDRSIRGININPSTKTFILFEDIDENRIYNNSADRIIDERTVTSKNVFIQGCVGSMAFGACATPVDSGDDINVTFQRPYPDALVEYDNTSYSGALLYILESESDAPSIAVQIDPAGQIFVHNI